MTATALPVRVTVNGRRHESTVEAATTLVDFLRGDLGLTGTKVGCDGGECGACTVLLDGVPVPSCLVLAVETDGRAVTTIEHPDDPRLGALAGAFVAAAGLQCGFCTPGMIMAAHPLPADADDATIRAALAGNLCRCTGYVKIVAAVRRAGRRSVGGRR